MNLVRPKAPVMASVVSNESAMRGKSANFVRHTVLDVSGTPLQGCFRAGQSFGVIAPGVDENGKAHKPRLYSIACPTSGEDGSGCWISTTPKRLIDETRPQRKGDVAGRHTLFLGVCSNYLCDLQPGDRVALSGPQGKRFLLPEDVDAHDYLLIATGTGIAPFRGMVMEMLMGPRPTTSRIELVMGVPYTTDLLYDDLFVELARKHANFNYHVAISREDQHLYVDALIDRNMPTFKPMLRNERTLIYLCGIQGMQQGLFSCLTRHAVAEPYIDTNGKPGRRCMLEVY